MNLLAELALSPRETVMSRALGSLCLHHAPFLAALLEAARVPAAIRDGTVGVAYEVAVGRDRPDLVVSWEDGTGLRHVAIVEHKIEAGEATGVIAQSERYAAAKDAIAAKAVAARGWTTIDVEPHLVMLGMWPWLKARATCFRTVTHEQLLPALRALADLPHPAASLARDWHEELAAFYAGRHVAPDMPWKPAIARATPGGLSTGLLSLEGIGDAVIVRAGLTGYAVDEVFVGGGLGRQYFGVKIAKPEWRFPVGASGATTDTHLHFQVTVNPTEDAVALQLQFEVHPYASLAEARRTLGPAVDAFRAARAQLHDALRPHCRTLSGSRGGPWNALSVFRFPADTVADIVREASARLVALAPHVDAARLRLGALAPR